jgi:elongation factor 1-gamma
LKNGYVRNLDHFRKYCFAAFGVYGVEGDYDIRGVFFWRGTEIPFEVSDHQSGDYYKFTKLDHTKEEDRKLLEDYWTHLEEGQIVDGKPIYDVKYFK